MTRHWTDLGFTAVVTELREYVVDFAVYEIEYVEPGPPEKLLWHRAGADVYPDPVETLAEAEPYLHGSVKWDGCSNWAFDEQERGAALHGCSRHDLVRLGEVMARCWDWAGELLPTWDCGGGLKA